MAVGFSGDKSPVSLPGWRLQKTEIVNVVLPEVFPESLWNIVLHLATHKMCKDVLYVFENFEIVVLAFIWFDHRLWLSVPITSFLFRTQVHIWLQTNSLPQYGTFERYLKKY